MPGIPLRRSCKSVFCSSQWGSASTVAFWTHPRRRDRDSIALRTAACAWHRVWLRAGLYVLADARLAGLPESEADMHHRFRCGGEHMGTDGNPRFARRVPDRAAPPAAHHVGEHRSRKGAVMSNRRMVLLGSLSLLAACGAPRPERAGGITGAPRPERAGGIAGATINGVTHAPDTLANLIAATPSGGTLVLPAGTWERHGSDRHCLYDQGCQYGADDH